MMKSIAVMFVIMSCCASCLFAGAQEIISLADPIYREIDSLYIMEGRALPSGTRPWSQDEASRILENLRTSSEYTSNRKAILLDSLKDGKEGFNYDLSLALEPKAMFQSGDSYATSFSVIPSDLEEDPFNLGVTLNHGNKLAGFININIGAQPGDTEDRTGYGTAGYTEMSTKYTHALGTNIPYIFSEGVNIDTPNRAYVSTGNEYARLTVGRDRLSWGNGEMGNLMLGDTLQYHDYLSVTYNGSRSFRYQLLASFFEHPDNYDLPLVNTTDPGAVENDYDRRPSGGGIRFMLGHRFEFRGLDDRLSFTLNESVMYQSSEGDVDYRVFNPLLILHNFYIAGNANSLASIEVAYAVRKNLNFYFQLACDDLAVFGEARQPQEGASANAYGAVLGLKFTSPEEEGYYFGSAELVYTSPFMYHRANGAYDDNDQSLYYVSTIRITGNGSAYNVSRYLSYAFGSDALAVQFKLGYRKFDSYAWEGMVFLMAHGIIDKYSRTHYYGDNSTDSTPGFLCTANPFDSSETGEIEYSAIVGGKGEYKLNDRITVNGSAYALGALNFGNEDGETRFDLQLTAGCSYAF